MPFARWENFQACTREQKEMGHSAESANKICRTIQARAEKGMLLKAEKHVLDVINKAGVDLIVGGYASWQIRDPQNDVITTKAQVRFLQKFFSEPEQFRNIMIKHGNFQVGTPLLKYTSPNGETVYSHVNEVGTYLICKIRDNNWRSVQKVRNQVSDGTLKMYSISGDPVEFEFKKEMGEMVRYIYDIDPWEVTLCEKGVNPKSNVRVLSKAEKLCKPCVEKWTSFYVDKGIALSKAVGMAEKVVLRTLGKVTPDSECNIDVCGGACCTFVTEWSARKDEDLKKYLAMHGIETKDAPGGMWLKYPIACRNFDEETKKCLDWPNRPNICKAYPRRESPFIKGDACNLLAVRGLLAKAEVVPCAQKKPLDFHSKLEEIFTRNWSEKVQ